MSDEAMIQLAEAMSRVFSDTELHAFIITASQPGTRDYQHWQRLQAAAIRATGCQRCVIEESFAINKR